MTGHRTSITGVLTAGFLIVVHTGQGASASSDLTGPSQVIDADTIKINGVKVRLYGLDAPEKHQTCRADNQIYDCGKEATQYLYTLIGDDAVRCVALNRDRYDRVLGICSANGIELNAALVSNGWAIAYRQYSLAYVEHEQSAKNDKKGLWSGQFIEPWRWRRGERLPHPALNRPKVVTEGKCLIKGNISRSGRIYHLPGGLYYERTQVDEAAGERWFCSISDAESAGWIRSTR